MKLVLVRHGKTLSNKEHRYLGKTDEGLSEEGIIDLQNGKAMGIYPDVDYLFSSPMKRCLETASIIYPQKDPIIILDWQEMDFGEFEGKNHLDLNGDKRYREWIDSNGTLPFPGGESREDFFMRCKKGLYEMYEHIISEENYGENTVHICDQMTIGLIVHGGTIMSLLSNLYGGDYYDYHISNGKGYVCNLAYKDGKISFNSLKEL